MRTPHMDGASSVIVVPTLNEESNIVDCLKSLLRGSLRCPIIVADGGSSDRTRSLVEDLALSEPRILLFDNPGRTQAKAINMVAAKLPSECKLLIRADAHSLYPSDFADVLLTEFAEVDANSVVVRMEAVGDSFFGRAAAYAQNSILGNGGASHRNAVSGGKFVDHGHHALFDLRQFRNVGGYDEAFSHNEDYELDFRLRKAGGTIWLTGATQVNYRPRSSPWALAKQYYAHGKGRARTTLKHRIVPKIRQVLPLAVVIAYVLGAALSPVAPIILAVPLLHLALCLSWGLWMSCRDRNICALASGPAAVIMHLSWGIGFCMEVIGNRRRDRKRQLASFVNENAT